MLAQMEDHTCKLTDLLGVVGWLNSFSRAYIDCRRPKNFFYTNTNFKSQLNLLLKCSQQGPISSFVSVEQILSSISANNSAFFRYPT